MPFWIKGGAGLVEKKVFTKKMRWANWSSYVLVGDLVGGRFLLLGDLVGGRFSIG